MKAIKIKRTLTIEYTTPVNTAWYPGFYTPEDALFEEQDLKDADLLEAMMMRIEGVASEDVTLTNECEIVDIPDEE